MQFEAAWLVVCLRHLALSRSMGTRQNFVTLQLTTDYGDDKTIFVKLW
jgi:hypothetical protein